MRLHLRPDRRNGGATFAEMRDIGVRRLLVYCADYAAANRGDPWPDDLRLSDIEDRFTCTACGRRGPDVRPDFNWDKMPIRAMGYLSCRHWGRVPPD